LNPLLQIHPSLTADTVAYRTMDFFSAAELITKRTLMFSRADTFPDRNEGIDRLLGGLELAIPNSGCGLGWTNDTTAREIHERAKRSHLISCWSKNSESVAMWSMYSTDNCSVRISTRISKLSMVAENLMMKYAFARLTNADIGKPVVVAVEGRIAPIDYVCLASISRKVTNRLKARNRLAARYARKGSVLPTLTKINPRYFEREKFRRIDELRKSFNMKDSSFEHEAEIRIAVRLAEEECSERLLQEQAFLDPQHEYHALANDIVRVFGLVTKTQLLEREFVQCPENFVETIAIDPRCPAHKASFIRDWFRGQGIKVVESSCFGYIPDSFDVFPEL